MATTEVERHTGVDIEDAPSAEWGWTGTAPRLWHVVLLLIAGFLVMMLHGNHVGRVEDWFLILFAGALVIGVARDWYLRRRGLQR